MISEVCFAVAMQCTTAKVMAATLYYYITPVPSCWISKAKHALDLPPHSIYALIISSCIRSKLIDDTHWWMVDLGSDIDVRSVKIQVAVSWHQEVITKFFKNFSMTGMMLKNSSFHLFHFQFYLLLPIIPLLTSIYMKINALLIIGTIY